MQWVARPGLEPVALPAATKLWQSIGVARNPGRHLHMPLHTHAASNQTVNALFEVCHALVACVAGEGRGAQHKGNDVHGPGRTGALLRAHHGSAALKGSAGHREVQTGGTAGHLVPNATRMRLPCCCRCCSRAGAAAACAVGSRSAMTMR